MLRQYPNRPPSEASTIADAVAAAEWRARNLSRRFGCVAAADEEDIRQAILLDLIARADRFDPARGTWPAFVSVVTRHAAAGIAEDQCRRAALFLPLAEDEPIDDRQPAGAADLAIDFAREVGRLPHPLKRLVDRIAETGTVAGARRDSAASPASFYRALRELRLRLIAAGLSVEGCARRPS